MPVGRRLLVAALRVGEEPGLGVAIDGDLAGDGGGDGGDGVHRCCGGTRRKFFEGATSQESDCRGPFDDEEDNKADFDGPRVLSAMGAAAWTDRPAHRGAVRRFREHGAPVIAEFREKHAAAYVQLIAKLAPLMDAGPGEAEGGMSEADIVAAIEAIDRYIVEEEAKDAARDAAENATEAGERDGAD